MSKDLRSEALKEPVDIAEYLFRRLHEVGIRSIHGVPGDYNLAMLDYIPKNGLNWVGNANELNAAYAADGYARVKGISAIVTTFGVGELSALNGLAGAYAEFVPVVHIVGTPSLHSISQGELLHHTLGNGDYTVFSKMSEGISIVSSKLWDASQAATEIDHAIRECYMQSRPVYITLPTDMVTKKVEGERLKTPIDLSLPANDPDQEDFVVKGIMHLLRAAQHPIILVDSCAVRHRALDEVHALIRVSNLPTFVAPMGQSAVDNTLPNFYGVYAGDGSHQSVRDMVESSDLVLSIGEVKSDFNTSGFTYRVSQLSTVDIHSNHTKVKYSEFSNINMHGILRRLIKELETTPLAAKPRSQPSGAYPQPPASSDETITHKWFWPQLSDWVQENDIVLTETGTAGYGIWETRFKRGTNHINQILWGSIGYATGSCQGAAYAAKDDVGDGKPKRRTILFTGDGSFQLTAQEVATMLRRELNPIVFVICNNGYTIERFIHGMEASYNDIGNWHYGKFLESLAGTGNALGRDESKKQNPKYKIYQVKTKSDVNQLLKDQEFANGDMLRFVELYMPWNDAPTPLVLTAEAAAKNNARQ